MHIRSTNLGQISTSETIKDGPLAPAGPRCAARGHHFGPRSRPCFCGGGEILGTPPRISKCVSPRPLFPISMHFPRLPVTISKYFAISYRLLNASRDVTAKLRCQVTRCSHFPSCTPLEPLSPLPVETLPSLFLSPHIPLSLPATSTTSCSATAWRRQLSAW